jgi:HSP20 family protein
MQDSNQGQSKQGRSNQIIFTVMILLLIVIAGMQTWYIVGIKKQLNTIQDQQSSIRSYIPATAEREIDKAAEPEEATTPTQPEPTDEQEKQSVQQLSPVDKDLTPDKPNSSADYPSRRPPYYAQRWDPYREIERMQREMERAFGHPYGPYNRPDFRRHFRADIIEPKMDVREDNKQYTVLVNIPGADAKSLSADLDGQRLTVSGKQEYEKQDRDASGQIIFSERRSGRFQRSITLREPVEQKGMKTKINNGVLTIIIPKMK